MEISTGAVGEGKQNISESSKMPDIFVMIVKNLARET